MEGPALGGGEAAGGVDRRDLVERRELDLGRCARRPPTGSARLRAKARATVGVEAVEHRPAAARRSAMRRADGRGERAPCARRAPRAPATASRTDRVIAETVSSVVESGTAPVGRHQARRALEADEPLQRGRDADRAAGVGAERGPGRAGGDRRRAARGRAAGHARRRVERRASPRWRAAGWCGLRPTPENANSDMWVRPMSAAPARAQAADGRARRRRAGGASRRIVEPAAVTSPATSNRSLIETARPASGPGSRPAATAASAARAAARAAVEAGGDEGRRGGRRWAARDRALDQRRGRGAAARGSAGALQ